jgi:AhpD family alkylhydroperoxidase
MLMSRHSISYQKLAVEPFNKLLAFSQAVLKSGVGTKLLDLVSLRVSQINGCAFCLDMHARDLLKQGEDLQRLVCLPAWREVEFYSARERAALEWAERVTDLHDEEALDAAFAKLGHHFSEQEIAELTFAVAMINVWNTLNVSLRAGVERKPLAA